MEKDKAWLKGEINHFFGIWWPETIDDVQDLMDIVEILIDQLEEQDINQAYKDGYDTGRMHASKTDKLLIPKFVADWWGTSDYVCLYGGMRCRKEAKFDLISLFHDRGLEDYLWKVEDWIDNNKDDFIDLVNGKSYEVEEEPKYYVVKEDVLMALLEKFNGAVRPTTTKFDNVSCIGPRYMLTEKEIKDFDERFWAFAVPVEKAEE